MITVTELSQIGGRRCDLAFDDGSTMTTSIQLATDYALYVGKVLTDEEFGDLLTYSSEISAKERALRIVGQRAISRRDLIKRLIIKGEVESAAIDAADWLEEKGYLNDADYACTIARHYASKGYGRTRIKGEMFKRGIDRDHWDFAMSDLPEPDEKIDRLLYSKLRGDPTPQREDLKKAVDYLARRGFSWDEIKDAVERYKQTIEETSDVL